MSIPKGNNYLNSYCKLANCTTCKIQLPFIKAEVDMPTSPHPERVKNSSETILLAEDDKVLRDMMSIVLKESGYCVIEAKDGQEAVRRFQDNQDAINLVVLDLIMPKMSGKEAGDAIMKMRPHAKILFQSGCPADAMEQEGLYHTKVHFLFKPVSLHELLKKVRELLDK